ncbi:hypothetical protein OWV82_007684 [Melia azedarach]|uniref:Uncharacterized protein n=1 Tax=Melia azedarach TaxID=155640 RepID=A0ACC1Y938_MELAZ|nr:hypothetical protein OWV82_007684 [Melia azedarach]
MENKAIKQVKKGKANTLPPRRGQIKLKILGELVETVVTIRGKQGRKNERGEDEEALEAEKARARASDDEKNRA